MGLAHSPRIVTNGLVFYYDSGNTLKSWLGAPTTNIVTTWNSGSGWTYAYNATPITVAEDTTQSLYSDVKVFRGVSTNTAGAGFAYSDFTIPTTPLVTYTCSCWVKSSQRQISIYMHDGTGANVSQSATYGSITLNGEWQRVYAPFVTTSSGIVRMHITTGTGVIGDIVYATAPQIELSPITTPYTSGTRTTANSILDLTRLNTITANSLTYASNNTFSFNGSNNMIIVPNNTALDSQTITMESWVNAASLNQNGFIFEKGTVNTQYSNFFSGGTFYFRTMGLTPQDLTFAVSSYITINQWYHIVCTYGSGTKTIYVNGNQVAQATGVTGTLATSTGGMSVGVYGGYAGVRAYYFNGSIAIVKTYNTTLSAADVKQNFKALKGRFGL